MASVLKFAVLLLKVVIRSRLLVSPVLIVKFVLWLAAPARTLSLGSQVLSLVSTGTLWACRSSTFQERWTSCCRSSTAGAAAWAALEI